MTCGQGTLRDREQFNMGNEFLSFVWVFLWIDEHLETSLGMPTKRRKKKKQLNESKAYRLWTAVPMAREFVNGSKRRIGSNKMQSPDKKTKTKFFFFFQRSNQTSFVLFFVFLFLVFPPCLNVVAKLLTKSWGTEKTWNSSFLFFFHPFSIQRSTHPNTSKPFATSLLYLMSK